MGNERNHRIIESATDSLRQAMEWDLQIAEDSSRHATWLTAFATSGVLLLITQVGSIVDRSILGHYSLIVLGCTAILFLTASVLGAIVRRSLRKGMSLKRQQMTYVLMHKTALLTQEPEKMSAVALEACVSRMAFLRPEQRRAYARLEEEEGNLLSENGWNTAVELILLLGFLLLIAAAVPTSSTLLAT